jgi:hypothetical protein
MNYTKSSFRLIRIIKEYHENAEKSRSFILSSRFRSCLLLGKSRSSGTDLHQFLCISSDFSFSDMSVNSALLTTVAGRKLISSAPSNGDFITIVRLEEFICYFLFVCCFENTQIWCSRGCEDTGVDLLGRDAVWTCGRHQRLGGACCLLSSAMKMEAVSPSKRLYLPQVHTASQPKNTSVDMFYEELTICK